MSNIAVFAKRAAIALMIASFTLPAAAFDGPDSFQSGGNGPDEPGPGDWGGPGGFAAPSGGGSGGGGSTSNGGGHSIAAQRNNECPGGNLVVDYRMDSDGHPIPASFTRTCVPFN